MNWFYVFSHFIDGIPVYARTTSNRAAADRWVKEYGGLAIYTINCLPQRSWD